MIHGPSSDDRLRDLAIKRHGIITRQEMTASCGLSGSGVDRRVRSGDLVRLHAGIYRLAGHPQTWEGDVFAAQLSAGSAAFSSHRTAGALYSLDGVPPETVEVCTYAGRRIPGVITHRLLPGDRPRTRILRELRIACVERTLLDLGAVLPIDAAATALDDALRRRLTTIDRMMRSLDSLERGRKGAGALRKLLRLRDQNDQKIRSKFESKMLWVLRNLPLPCEADFQVVLASHTHYLDFAFPPYRLGIECHSAGWHKNHSRWMSDIARHRRLIHDGWLILYFAWEEVISNPQGVLEEIGRALKARGAAF